MNKAITSTPKPQIRILLGGADGGASQIVRKGPKIFRYSRSGISDLDAAVHSITADGNVTQVNSGAKKAFVNPKIMTLNSSEEKLEKIVFLPKFVQKKVTVVRGSKDGGRISLPSPKVRSLNLNQVKLAPKPVPKFEGEIGTAKKRKVGDFALASWDQNKKANSSVNNMSSVSVGTSQQQIYQNQTSNQNTLLCRLCGSVVNDDDEVIELNDTESGNMTPMGLKLKAIVNYELPENANHPSVCCKLCGGKVKLCFSLMTELQATHQVARKTFEEAEADVNPSTQMYTCTDCDQEVMGMKIFVQHYETHYLEKTLGAEPTSTESNDTEYDSQDLVAAARSALETITEDDGLTTLMTEDGQFMCELCGKLFPYKFQLTLHRKAPRRQPKVAEIPVVEEVQDTGSTCYVCGQAKTGLNKCKLVGGEILDICSDCRSNVTFMIV